MCPSTPPSCTCYACAELHLLGRGQLLLQPTLLLNSLILQLLLVSELAVVKDPATQHIHRAQDQGRGR